MRPKDEIGTCCRPCGSSSRPVLARVELSSRVCSPYGIDIEQIGEKVVCQNSGAGGQDALGRTVIVGAESAHAAYQNRQLGRRQRQLLGLVYEKLFGASQRPAGGIAIVAEAVALRIEEFEASNICVVLSRIDTADREWYLGGVAPAVAGSLLDSSISAEDNEVSQGYLLVLIRLVEIGFDGVQLSLSVSFSGHITRRVERATQVQRATYCG